MKMKSWVVCLKRQPYWGTFSSFKDNRFMAVERKKQKSCLGVASIEAGKGLN